MFKVLGSYRAVMSWEGWESPACVLSPQQFYLESLISVGGCTKLGMRQMSCVTLLPSLGRQSWRPALCRSYSGDICKLE